MKSGVQRFGKFLSAMVMPNIGAFIAWGFITYSIGTIATGKFKEIKPEIYVLAIVFGIYIFFGL